jgi:gamma-glutamyltranspeptidase/glutathione hydrolase
VVSVESSVQAPFALRSFPRDSRYDETQSDAYTHSSPAPDYRAPYDWHSVTLPSSFAHAQDAVPGGGAIAYRGEQPVKSAHGMVVSVHHLAADAGLEILKAGGNAVDAAVATGFALAVVHPFAGNLGGGGFMLIRTHDGHATFLDYREEAPAAATADMYLDAKGDVLPADNLQSSITGYRAIATPGSVAGMTYAEKKYGKLGLAKVMAPAIRLAEDGYTLTEDEAHLLANPGLALFPDSKRIFQRDGKLYQTGEVFKQPELAKTLRALLPTLKTSTTARLAAELAAELKKGGGLITLDDLAHYEVKERTPLVGSFHDYTVISSPPSSSGGIVLLSALNILEPYNLTKFGDRSPEWIHTVTEAYRRAYMDRSDYLGDPDFNKIPVAELTSKNTPTPGAPRSPIRPRPAPTCTGRKAFCRPRPPRPEQEGLDEHDALFRRRQRRQRGQRNHHAEQCLRVESNGREPGFSAQ